MKALAYDQAHDLTQFAIAEREVAEPAPRPGDLVVRIKAVAVNPVDTKVRKSRSGSAGGPVILGYDAAGVVELVGPEARGFKVGDEVFYAGDITWPGSYAERQAIDARLAAKKPARLSFTEAAALPLTALTAYEALLEREYFPFTKDTKVLVIGTGGVGAIAIQLLRQLTPARVIATASRPETERLARSMGAHEVIDHHRPLAEQLGGEVDLIFSTTHSAGYARQAPALLRPFGHFVLIDDPESLDIMPFKLKAQSVHWEFMFAKSMHRYREASQGQILAKVAALIDEGKLRTTAGVVLPGFRAANVRQAHEIIESGKATGKIVIDFEA
jgi:NADPH:quinone reductase